MREKIVSEEYIPKGTVVHCPCGEPVVRAIMDVQRSSHMWLVFEPMQDWEKNELTVCRGCRDKEQTWRYEIEKHFLKKGKYQTWIDFFKNTKEK